MKLSEVLRRVTVTESGCWEWTGTRTGRLGYGRLTHEGRQVVAHRVVYELLEGPLPAGLELDHLCRNPPCVNPAHLEPVTHQENVLRGEGLAAHQARQTHCKRGHAFTPENTYMEGGKKRRCRVCTRAAWRAYYHRKGRAA